MDSNVILDHFRNPKNCGFIKDADGIGIEKDNPWMIVITISVKIREGIIRDIKFKTQGCLTSIASSSIITEMVLGKSIEDGLALSYYDVVTALGQVPQEKIHCCQLATGALHKAISDYLNKNEWSTFDGQSAKNIITV
jgi:nitrogen fixation protein NifU and related proteins